MFAFGPPKQEQRDRSDKARGSWNWKAGEIFCRICAVLSCRGRIESRKTQRAAGEINEGEDPAGARKILEHDPINHQRRRQAKGNNVGERIEFAPESGFVSAKARKPAIEKIENESAEHVPNCFVKKIRSGNCIRALQKRALENFERGGKATEQISRCHQVRQKINLRRLVVHLIGEPRDN